MTRKTRVSKMARRKFRIDGIPDVPGPSEGLKIRGTTGLRTYRLKMIAMIEFPSKKTSKLFLARLQSFLVSYLPTFLKIKGFV